MPCLDAHVLEAVQRLLAAHLLQQAHMLAQHVQLQHEGTKLTAPLSRNCLHTVWCAVDTSLHTSCSSTALS